MLSLDKSTVDFLVTEEMAVETERFLLSGRESVEPITAAMISKKIDRLYFVGCGSSMAAGSSGKYLLDRYTGIVSQHYTGWEFADNPPYRLNNRSAVVLISHSGTTEEIVEAMKLAQNRGAMTVGVVNQKNGNPLGCDCDHVIAYEAHAMWECHLLAVYLLCISLSERSGGHPELRRIAKDLNNLPKVLANLIHTFEGNAFQLATSAADWKGFYTLAAGPLRSLAYKEGIITNMEFMWGHGSVLESGEFRHGPLEITDEKSTFLVLLGTDASRHTTERALDFIQKYGGRAIVFDYQDFAQGLHPDLAPLVMFAPLEWFCYYFATVRDHNPDDRRYYNVVAY